MLAYASDMTLLDSTLIAHGRTVFDPEIQAASLDHALWFHRPFRADEWLLYAQDSPSTGGARGFARGSIFTRDGRLVASVAQEGLIRSGDSAPDMMCNLHNDCYLPEFLGCKLRDSASASLWSISRPRRDP